MSVKTLSIILGIFLFFTFGCTKSNDSAEGSNDNQGDSNNINEVIDVITPSVISDLKIEGDIKDIYYSDEDTILIAADKLYLYDIETGKVLNEVTRETFESENLWVIDSGYVAVRQSSSRINDASIMSNVNFNYEAIFYDGELNEVSDMNLNHLLEEDDMLVSTQAISFNTSGSQVAYATYSGIYIYDFEKEKKVMVIDLTSMDTKQRAGIVNIEQISFTDEDRRIAFKAQSFNVPAVPDEPSFDTCGTVNIDGSELMNQRFDNYTCKKLTSYDNLLLFAEDPSIATGRTLVMEMPSEKIKIFNQITRNESGNIWGSIEGGFFATSTLNDSGWTIRVYNTKTGELEAEQKLSNDGEERYLEHDPIIRVIDGSRTYIVLLGSKQDDITTKMMISKF